MATRVPAAESRVLTNRLARIGIFFSRRDRVIAMGLGFAEGLARAGEFLASVIEKEGLDIIATKDLETNNDNSITVVNALPLKTDKSIG